MKAGWVREPCGWQTRCQLTTASAVRQIAPSNQHLHETTESYVFYTDYKSNLSIYDSNLLDNRK
jgi:hypothetical protein